MSVTDKAKIRAAIIGCGNIAGPYTQDLRASRQVELVGMTDLDPSRSDTLASKYACQVYPTMAELLADETLDLVVNLTSHQAHRNVTRACLEAGKHVYSEKPLAMTAAEAQELVAIAHQRGLRLGCSPFTFMGEAQQTAWKWIRDDRLGTIRVVYAEVNWGRIETWHPSPESFYEVGPLFDVGVYPLTLLTTIFGPARRVLSYGRTLKPERLTKSGAHFRVGSPDFAVTMVELASGVVARLTTNFYVTQQSKQAGIEFHGDQGSLYLSSWQRFDAGVEFAEFGQPFSPVPLLKDAYPGTPWGFGVLEMADAILEGRPHRASGEQAAHVVEILCAAAESMQNERPVEITSSFSPPEPMGWAV